MKEFEIIKDLLRNLKYGKLEIISINGKVYEFTGTESLDIAAKVKVKNNIFWKRIVTRHDIGLGESYMNDEIEVDDLYRLLYILCLNADRFEEFYKLKPLWEKLKDVLTYFKNKNTLRKSQKNISDHYDVGNEFYKLWLDETMMYSSALYEGDDINLTQAQNLKLDRILRQIGEAKYVWEIGAGWGGFMKRAVEKGKIVKGISLSKEQIKIANEKMKLLGKYPESEAVYEDYRNTIGQYDAVVSIEMIEAVGREYWDTYFAQIYKNLKKGGVAVVQVILKTPEESFERYLNSNDFIREYTFPGGTLLSKSTVEKYIIKNNMQIKNWHHFGRDYAKTLLTWMDNFDRAYLEILALGYSKRFIKQWRFYFALCAAGFDAGTIDVAQVTFIKK